MLSKELQAFINNCHELQPKAENKTTKVVKTAKAPKEAVENECGAKVGDVLYSSWGYEQTNYNFYEVIAVTKKTVTLKGFNEYFEETIYKNRRTLSFGKDSYQVNGILGDFECPKCYYCDRKAFRVREQASYASISNVYFGH